MGEVAVSLFLVGEPECSGSCYLLLRQAAGRGFLAGETCNPGRGESGIRPVPLALGGFYDTQRNLPDTHVARIRACPCRQCPVKESRSAVATRDGQRTSFCTLPSTAWIPACAGISSF